MLVKILPLEAAQFWAIRWLHKSSQKNVHTHVFQVSSYAISITFWNVTQTSRNFFYIKNMFRGVCILNFATVSVAVVKIQRFFKNWFWLKSVHFLLVSNVSLITYHYSTTVHSINLKFHHNEQHVMMYLWLKFCIDLIGFGW